MTVRAADDFDTIRSRIAELARERDAAIADACTCTYSIDEVYGVLQQHSDGCPRHGAAAGSAG